MPIVCQFLCTSIWNDDWPLPMCGTGTGRWCGWHNIQVKLGDQWVVPRDTSPAIWATQLSTSVTLPLDVFYLPILSLCCYQMASDTNCAFSHTVAMIGMLLLSWTCNWAPPLIPAQGSPLILTITTTICSAVPGPLLKNEHDCCIYASVIPNFRSQLHIAPNPYTCQPFVVLQNSKLSQM